VNKEERIAYLKDKLNDCTEVERPQAFNALAQIYMSSEPQLALDYAEQALSITIKQNEKYGEAVCLQTLGLINYYSANNLKAIEFYNRSTKIADEIHNFEIMSSNANNLGIIYDNMGDYEKSLEMYLSSLRTCEEKGWEFAIAPTILNIGEIYNKLEKLELAKECFERSYEIYYKMNNHIGVLQAANNLTNILLKGNDLILLKEKISFLEENVGSINDLLIKLDIKRTLTNYFMKISQYEKAETQVMESIDICNSLKNDEYLIITYNLAAKLEIAKGNLTKAESWLQCSGEKLKEYSSDHLSQFRLVLLIDLYKKKGDLPGVIKYLEENERLTSKIDEAKFQKRFSDLRVQYEIEKEQQKTKELKRINDKLEQFNRVLKSKNEKIISTYFTLKKISEIGQKITSFFDLEKIYHLAYESASELIEFEKFAIGLLENDYLIYKFVHKNAKEKGVVIRIKDDNSISRWIIDNKKALKCNDVAQSAMQYVSDQKVIIKDIFDAHSAVFVPLISSDKVIGVLSVQTTKSHGFSNNHFTMLKALGTYMAIALDNAMAYEMIQNRQNQILELEKKNAILAMAITANHEINQPLMVIQGNMEMLSEKIKNEIEHSNYEKYINNVESSVKRISLILNRYKNIRKFSMRNYSEESKMVNIDEVDEK